MHTTNFERVLDTLAAESADRKLAELDLVDPQELARHLKLTAAVAGAAFLATVGLVVLTRVVDLPEKRLALASVVTLAFAALCAVAVFSCVGAAATAYARQRVALLRAQGERETLALRQRQSELDAMHATQRSEDLILAWQVGSDVLFQAAQQENGPPSVLDSFGAYTQVAQAWARDEEHRVAGNTDLLTRALKIFNWYEAWGHGPLSSRPVYSRIRMKFEELAFQKAA